MRWSSLRTCRRRGTIIAGWRERSSGFCHSDSPAGWSDGGASDFLINARKLAGIQPNAMALWALIDLDLSCVREPAAREHLGGTTRAKTRLTRDNLKLRILPHGVECSSGGSIDTAEFFGVKPDATAAAIADVYSH